MITIEQARELIGQKVVYRAPHLKPAEPGEEGVVTSVNDTWVFVRYGSQAGSCATSPLMLEAIS